MAFGNFTLVGEFDGLSGIPAVGTVRIDGNPQVVIDATGNKFRVGPRMVTLDTSGKFSVDLPSDVTTGNSISIAYRVTVNLKHQNLAPVNLYARAIGTQVDLARITSQTIPELTVLPAGPKGDKGDPGIQGLPGPNSVPALAATTTYVAANLARNPDLLIAGTITRDGNGAATSAPVTWPDGTPGTYTAITVSAAFPGAVDAYQITYGSPVTKTYTQPLITRNADGAATVVPAITVA